jgi:hypothetical protein
MKRNVFLIVASSLLAGTAFAHAAGKDLGGQIVVIDNYPPAHDLDLAKSFTELRAQDHSLVVQSDDMLLETVACYCDVPKEEFAVLRSIGSKAGQIAFLPVATGPPRNYVTKVDASNRWRSVRWLYNGRSTFNKPLT